MSAWDKLSMFERADIMKLAVNSGVYNLDAIRNGYNKFAEGGDTKEKELPPIIPFRQKMEVVITPDQKYNTYLNTLPDNQRFTPNDAYDSYLYWKLNGKPKNFKEAYNKGMFTYNNSDKLYHADSIAFGDDGVGYFMKPKTHSTVGFETDWYNKGLVTEEGGTQRPMTSEERAEWLNFRNQYDLIDDPNRPNYYRYEPKNKHSMGGPIVKVANEYKHGGEIHIDPSKKGTFTAAASKHGMGVQEFASKVLANKEDYSPTMVKKANFARNSKKWKHGEGGNLFSGEEKHSQQIATKSKQAPWYSELGEAVLGEVMQQFRNIAYPGNFKDVSYKGDARGKNGGTAQRTYLLPRSEQEDIFLRDGYIKGNEGDYGLVKKAVNNRNLPVWQTKPDAVSRKTLVPIGNVYGWDYGYINRDKDLVHAGAHPAAFYVDGSTGKLYTKGWDLNDYGGTGGGESSNYGIFKKAGANILDFIGNPVVVTTGFQEVTNPWGGASSHLSRGATIQDLFDDDYYGASTVGKMLDTTMSKKGLHREEVRGKWLYALPEVTVAGKKKR